MEEKGRGSCDHIGLFTNDASRLVRFYRDALGFTVESDTDLPASLVKTVLGLAADCRLVKMTLGAVAVELIEPRRRRLGRRRDSAAGFNHWGLATGDRAGFVEELKRRRVPVVEGRRGDRSVFFVRDPDGNRIEIRD